MNTNTSSWKSLVAPISAAALLSMSVTAGDQPVVTAADDEAAVAAPPPVGPGAKGPEDIPDLMGMGGPKNLQGTGSAAASAPATGTGGTGSLTGTSFTDFRPIRPEETDNVFIGTGPLLAGAIEGGATIDDGAGARPFTKGDGVRPGSTIRTQPGAKVVMRTEQQDARLVIPGGSEVKVTFVKYHDNGTLTVKYTVPGANGPAVKTKTSANLKEDLTLD